MADLPESQIPRAGATAEGADAAHVLGLLVEQAGASKVHFSGSSRLIFIDRGAPRSSGNSHAMRAWAGESRPARRRARNKAPRRPARQAGLRRSEERRV